MFVVMEKNTGLKYTVYAISDAHIKNDSVMFLIFCNNQWTWRFAKNFIPCK